MRARIFRLGRNVEGAVHSARGNRTLVRGQFAGCGADDPSDRNTGFHTVKCCATFRTAAAVSRIKVSSIDSLSVH